MFGGTRVKEGFLLGLWCFFAGGASSVVVVMVVVVCATGEAERLRFVFVDFAPVVVVEMADSFLAEGSASEEEEESEDDDEDERAAPAGVASDAAVAGAGMGVGVGTRVTLESEDGLEFSGSDLFFNVGTAKSLSSEEEAEEDSESEDTADLLGGRGVSLDPVTVGLVSCSDSLLEESEAEELSASDEDFPSVCGFGLDCLDTGLGDSVAAVGLVSAFFIFLVAGSSPPLGDAELEDADGELFRFIVLASPLTVGFLDAAPSPAVSFSSSASLSELEVDDEVDFGAVETFDLRDGFPGVEASFIFTSESLSPPLFSLLSSVFSSLLPLLLIRSASLAMALLAFRSLLAFLYFRVSTLSSASLLLVSSIFLFSSYTLSQSL